MLKVKSVNAIPIGYNFFKIDLKTINPKNNLERIFSIDKVWIKNDGEYYLYFNINTNNLSIETEPKKEKSKYELEIKFIKNLHMLNFILDIYDITDDLETKIETNNNINNSEQSNNDTLIIEKNNIKINASNNSCSNIENKDKAENINLNKNNIDQIINNYRQLEDTQDKPKKGRPKRK